jgi:small subunit ribosomal protein S16
MSVRIRLRRMGAKKQPFYRVVVADSRSPRDGRFLDTIGTYNPRTEPAAIDIDREKTMKWLEEGALPTDSARALLSRAGIWQEFKTGAPAQAGTVAEPSPAAQAPAPTPAPSDDPDLPAEGGMDAPVEGDEEINTME